MIKYLILDFGKVFVYPTTGEWFITPLFLKIVNMNKIDKEELLEAIKEFNYIVSQKLLTQDEEFSMYQDFYAHVFAKINYKIKKEDLDCLAYDITYNDFKYTFYDNVKAELEVLSKKYTLLMLTDNWPCVFSIMKKNGLDVYFDKIYVSSIYGVQKKDKVFFNYPIKDYHIKAGEAIFVDDNEKLLDIAVEKGLDVRLMDREYNVENSKYQIIHNLLEI